MLKLGLLIGVVILLALAVGLLNAPNAWGMNPGNILDYYRGLGEDPNEVELTDVIQAVNDYNNGIIPPGFNSAISLEQVIQLLKEDMEVGQCDIVLNAGENELNVILSPITPFDPWVYDKDNSCYIELGELVQAGNDYVAGLITEVQLGKVKVLYQDQTRNPTCISPPPMDYLTLNKSELYSYLIDGSVARDWWGLDYDYRRELGLKIINWWSVKWFGLGLALAKGESGCGGMDWFDPYQEPERTIGKKIGIGMEFCSGLRYCLFSDNSIAPTDVYWFRGVDDTWYCYNPGACFHLPTGVAIGDADWLNSLQVGEDINELSSWIFFQTWLADGYPGCDSHHWPIIGRSIAIFEVTGISDRGVARLGTKIVEIHY